ncbi:MAG: hypothetical protein K8R67_05615 [Desulfobacteraceae bacterium]|nr:hypothetical protein [Desulfobacteraceae bacterium]
MENKKHIQLELPFSFMNGQKTSNLISFPHKTVLEKIHNEKEVKRETAIKKGIGKCAKSLKWYHK